jgi:hypothetical protein
MRARFCLLIALFTIAVAAVPSAAQVAPERHGHRTPTVVREPGRLPELHHHADPSVVAVGPGHPQLANNFERLDHVSMPGRQAAADVYFFDHGFRGKFAYVGSFRAPCTSDGVRIIDVTRPRHVSVAATASLPDSWKTSTEDVVVERVGDRRILAGGLQACGEGGRNGLALWDVSRPRHPDLLSFLRTPAGVHELDLAVRGDGTVLALLATPFVEFGNTYFGGNGGGEFRIIDITHPRNPERLSTWGIIRDSDLVTFGGDEIISSFQGMDSFFTAIYAHSVRDADDGMTAYVSYWDAGIVKLDISDPAAPTFVGRTFYEIGDAGDGHSMFPLDVGGTRYLITNDEDYDPNSPVTVTSSETGGTEFNGMAEPWMPATLYDSGNITGDVVDAGDGCEAADFLGVSGNVALVDTVDPFYEGIIEGWTVPCGLRGQIRRAANAGATALLSNLISPDDPYAFPYGPPGSIAPDEDMVVIQVADVDGLADQLRAAAGTPSATFATNTPAVGYVRIFDESQLVDSDGDGQAQEFAEVATFTEPAYVFDDLTIPHRGIWSVHNTEVRDTIAYSSWYSHGVVAWDLSTINSPVQVGQYRPPAGRGWPEVWGVAFDPESGVVYLSDLVGGLWVVKPTGPAAP